jgi:hypothetical protein
VQEINAGNDYTSFFHNNESEQVVEQNATFRTPQVFEQNIAEVKKIIKRRE